MHTNIATALLDEIKERKLDTFFEAEEKMITRSTMVRGEREGEGKRERDLCIMDRRTRSACIQSYMYTILSLLSLSG